MWRRSKPIPQDLSTLQPPAVPGPGSRLDFSQAHFLDHSLLACHGLPGGRRRHLQHRWSFQWRQQLRAASLCRLGRHDERVAWRFDGETRTPFVMCVSCYHRPRR